MTEWGTLVAAAQLGHPWPVWQALRELLPAQQRAVPPATAIAAAAAGCEATLEALVGPGVCEEHGAEPACLWYAAAAHSDDLGTLSRLMRLGVPLGEGVLAAAVREGAPVCAAWLAGQRGGAGRAGGGAGGAGRVVCLLQAMAGARAAGGGRVALGADGTLAYRSWGGVWAAAAAACVTSRKLGLVLLAFRTGPCLRESYGNHI